MQRLEESRRSVCQVAVLIVEDNQDTCASIAKILKERGPKDLMVASVGTLEAAKESCRQNHPDVILLDLNLPDSSGPATFYQLRQEVDDAVPIVLLTGESIPWDELLTYGEAGAEGVYLKGADTECCFRTVFVVIGRTMRRKEERLRWRERSGQLLAEIDKARSGSLKEVIPCSLTGLPQRSLSPPSLPSRGR